MALTKVQIDGVEFSDSTDLNVDNGTLVVDATNNRVGIGTTSPNNSLDVVSDSGGIAVNIRNRSTDDYGYLRFQNNAGSSTQASIGNIGGQLAFETGATERLRIDSSGRLGLGTSSPAALLHLRDNNAVIRLEDINDNQDWEIYGSDLFRIRDVTNSNTDRFVINSSGNVGIGTTSPSATLQVSPSSGSANFQVSRGSKGLQINQDSDSADPNINAIGTTAIKFLRDGSESARFDTSGRLLVGTSTARSNFFNAGSYTPRFQLEGDAGTGTTMLSVVSSATDLPSYLILARQKSGSIGGNTILANGDAMGNINFQASDGTQFVTGAQIYAEVDGTPGANDMPTRLVFSTTADGASSPTERVRINATGELQVGVQNPTGNSYVWAKADSNVAGIFDRISSDGSIILLRQDGADEGSISVSGTTVSYNGAHLSRWSQLPGGVERTEILRGSVLSNIDEMCEWGDEDNEQLNRMKVSDVEGDKNVSGVFQAWDDDDDTYTNDFYCAMTGDFVIRIAQGVTVERGDLLMSAGDGTAKPQDDDIIRSKTIAKVTSTHVSETYADGSYCVPCVLMAC